MILIAEVDILQFHAIPCRKTRRDMKQECRHTYLNEICFRLLLQGLMQYLENRWLRRLINNI